METDKPIEQQEPITPDSAMRRVSGILKDRNDQRIQETLRKKTQGVVWEDEDEEEKRDLVRAALAKQEYAKARTQVGSFVDFSETKTLAVEHFVSDESVENNGISNSRNRNISIEEYRRKNEKAKPSRRRGPSPDSDANSRQLDMVDYMRAGSEDINKTRGAQMSAQDFDWNAYQKMAPKRAREYLHKLRVQNEKFTRSYQKREGYFYRMFLRKKQIYKDREPFEIKIKKKANRRKKLIEGGVDLKEDDAISLWSD